MQRSRGHDGYHGPHRDGLLTGLVAAFPLLIVLTCWQIRSAPALPDRPLRAAEAGQLAAPMRRALELEDWPALLDALTGDPLTNATLRLVTVRGLFEAGRLPTELFSWVHLSGPDLLTTSSLEQYSGAAHLAETLLQIGYLNGAERLAFDSLEMEGENPTALRALVRIHLVRGLNRAARVFLNRLQSYPEQVGWADLVRAALESGPPTGAEPSLARIRANLITQNRIVSGLTTDRVLRLALEVNPTNRMAFEYLLAHQLLGRELLPMRSLLANSPLFREGPLPRHYGEALLVHRAVYPAVALGPLLERVPAAVTQEFTRFQAMMKSGRASVENLQPQAWREFGNTYWYYYFFGHLGIPAEKPASTSSSAPSKVVPQPSTPESRSP